MRMGWTKWAESDSVDYANYGELMAGVENAGQLNFAQSLVFTTAKFDNGHC
jgi:hypothetical protein